MDDSRTAVLSLEASAIRGNASRHGTAILVVCSTRDSSAHAALSVAGDVSSERDGQGRLQTRWREDANPPTEEQWAPTAAGTTFASAAYDQRYWIHRLGKAQRILAEVPLADGSTAIAVFQPAGIEQALTRLAAICGWKP